MDSCILAELHIFYFADNTEVTISKVTKSIEDGNAEAAEFPEKVGSCRLSLLPV